MSHLQDKALFRGTSKTYRLTVVDADEARVDLTGATVYFRVKLKLEDASPVIQKASTTPAQITLLDQTVAATKGQADIFISPSDTSGLASGSYRYDVWVQLASGKRYAVVEPAPFVINRAITEL